VNWIASHVLSGALLAAVVVLPGCGRNDDGPATTTAAGVPDSSEAATFRAAAREVETSQLSGPQVEILDSAVAEATGDDVTDSSDVEERRAEWTSSKFQGRPEPPLPFRAQRIYPQLSFNSPTVLTSAPGTERMFVARKKGKIFALPVDRDSDQADLFLDVNDLVDLLNQEKEKKDHVTLAAVYGLTFHPQFAENRYCYLCYVVRRVAPGGPLENGSRVVRLQVTNTDPPKCLPETEQEVITWLEGGHNGGCIKFGADGYLYVSTGDGSTVYPPDEHRSGQDVSNLLSSILRIDVDHPQEDQAYTIPEDNPFVDRKRARGEVWAYGLRNPWKMSFDRQSGELWVADVGWELWEMVYRVSPGANFGWSLFEGRQPVHPDWQPGPTPVTPPWVDIPHSEGASVTGGIVYRGNRFPELSGMYLFGDWETRRVWGIHVDAEQPVTRQELVEPTIRVVGFAEDNDGEVYLLDYDDGTIHELVHNKVDAQQHPFPRRLSEAGVFASVAEHRLAEGVVEFSVNAEMWADHATAIRAIGIPGQETIKLHPASAEVAGSSFLRIMDFPQDTVLVKTISLDMVRGDPLTRRFVETQVLHYDGWTWRGYTYEWNEEQTDAELVDATGARRLFQISDSDAPGGQRKQVWQFAARSQCVRCHNPWTEHTLAFNLAQLNRPRDNAGQVDNQISWLRQTGVFEHVAQTRGGSQQPVTVEHMPRLTDPHDPSETIEARTRAYLHVNCSHCHRFNGGGSAYLYLTYDKPVEQMAAVGRRPSHGLFGIQNGQILMPGDPFRSLLYYRMSKLGPGHMPHIGSQVIDQQGVALVHDWIRQLPPRVEDQTKIDRLVALDESAILAREKQERENVLGNVARRIAQEKGRDQPGEDDFQSAEKEVTHDAELRVTARSQERSELTEELLANPSSAMVVVRSLRERKLPPWLRESFLATVASREEPIICDLFRPFLGVDDQFERLGDVIDADAILQLEGDIDRGRELFFVTKSVLCRKCHRVGDQGTELGPDLSQIGKKHDRRRILASILEPAKEIDPKYINWQVETEVGQVFSGIIVSRDQEHITLKDAENKIHRLATEEVESTTPQRTSIMPDLLLRDFTAQQVADLLAFLQSLKAGDAPYPPNE